RGDEDHRCSTGRARLVTGETRTRSSLHLHVAAQDPADRVGVWVSPAEAERVAGRVGVDLVPLDSYEVGGCLQQPGPERSGFGVRARRVVDVQIYVDLLRVPVRPIG